MIELKEEVTPEYTKYLFEYKKEWILAIRSLIYGNLEEEEVTTLALLTEMYCSTFPECKEFSVNENFADALFGVYAFLQGVCQYSESQLSVIPDDLQEMINECVFVESHLKQECETIKSLQSIIS